MRTNVDFLFATKVKIITPSQVYCKAYFEMLPAQFYEPVIIGY